MGNSDSRGRDAFELYNEGVDLILKECRGCQDILDKLKECEEAEEKATREDRLAENRAEEEVAQVRREYQEAEKKYELEKQALEQKIKEAEKDRIAELTPEKVAALTQDYRQNKDAFRQEEMRYLEEKKDPELRLRLERKAAELNAKEQSQPSEEKERAERRILEWLEEQRKVNPGKEDFYVILQEDISMELALSGQMQREWVRQKVDELLYVKGERENGSELQRLEKYKKSLDRREKLRSMGSALLCLPMAMIKGVFEKRQSDSEDAKPGPGAGRIFDIASIVIAVILSCFMWAKPELWGMILQFTLIAGLAYGVFLVIRGRTQKRLQTALEVVKGVGLLCVVVLPYPYLLYIVTRNAVAWILWFLAGLTLQFIFEWIRLIKTLIHREQIRDCMSKLEALLKSLQENAARIRGLEARSVAEELQNLREEMLQIDTSVREEEKQLRDSFAGGQWDRLVESFEAEQERKRQEQIAQNANVDKRVANYRKQIAAHEQELEEAENRQEERLAEERKKREEVKNALDTRQKEWEKKKEELEAEFKKRLGDLTDHMSKNGFADLCGFDYREAWAVMHGIATNAMCEPSPLEYFLGVMEDSEVQHRVIQSILAWGEGKSDSYERHYMPRSILLGFRQCDKIDEKISRALERAWGDKSELLHVDVNPNLKELGFKKLPGDGLYKLCLINSLEKPMLFYYDFGDLADAVNSKRRNDLWEYIMRTFAFRSYAHIGEHKHYRCTVLETVYSVEFDKFMGKKAPIKWEKEVVAERFSDRLKELVEHGRSVSQQVGADYGSLYNKVRHNNGKPKGDERYRVLILPRMQRKMMEDSNLKNLLTLCVRGGADGNTCGIYPYLFLDLNMLSKERQEVEVCVEFVKSFDGIFCELLLPEKEDGEFSLRESARDELAGRLNHIKEKLTEV